MKWIFVILVCANSDCTDVRSLAIYDTRAECIKGADFYAAHSLTDYRVSMIECMEKTEI